MAFKSVLCLCTIALLCSADDSPSVTTKLGVINGLYIKTSFNKQSYTISRYAGIRYAKVPIGELRFEKPKPFGKFPAPLDASSFTSSCPQGDMMNLGLIESKDEDCLSLNVYVPSDKSDQPYGHAVMVFIHGGGFAIGGSDTVPSEILSGFGNVIAVTINYRLGLLGFANTGDSQITGNMGLWDQRLALQWVKDNIASFGGDSSRITIFGESAGSMSVNMHGMYPPNKNLFQNIIAQSGAPGMPFPVVTNNLPSLTIVAEKLECSTESTAAILKCLKHADVVTIMDTMGELLKDPENMMKIQFSPTIDGDFIKRAPIDVLLEAKQKPNDEMEFLQSLRLINGINSAEGAMWLIMLVGEDKNPENIAVSQESMETMHITGMLAALANGRSIPDSLVSLVNAEYTNWNNPDDARDMYVKLMGDLVFNVPGAELSLIHANSSESKSWLYSFDASIEKHLLPVPSWIKGANHADELAPVFGYCTSGPIAERLNMTDYTPPQWELDMSARIMTYWTNFAKFGDPNGKSAETMNWPPLNVDSKQHIKIDRADSVGQNLYAKEMNFWREIVPLLWDAVEHAHSNDPRFHQNPRNHVTQMEIVTELEPPYMQHTLVVSNNVRVIGRLYYTKVTLTD